MHRTFILLYFAVFAFTPPLVTRANAQAVIDEAQVKKTLYVSLAGDDANNGLKPESSFASIQKAVDSIGDVAARILLDDGQYRQYVTVGKGDKLLVIEARHSGKAVINGADVMTDWQASATDGVLQHEWPHKWGLGQEFSWWGGTPVNRRREMIYVNDKRLTQRLDDAGQAVPPAELKPGEFTIDEAKAKVLVRPDAGMDFTNSEVEMPVRGFDLSAYPWVQSFSRPLFLVRNHSNLVIRGLVIKRAANYMKFGAALEIAGPDEASSAEELPENVLIDRITVIENNAIGMEISNYRNVTVTDSTFNDNGERGAGMVQVGAERHKDPKAAIAPRNYLWRDCRFNHNNWRMAGTWGDMNDSAGFKAFGQSSDKVSFLRCQFSHNQANGYWQDYFGSNVVLDHCLVEHNSGTGAAGYGILSEMTRGPFTVRDSVIRNNTNAGIVSSGAPDVHIENNTIYHNNFVPGKSNNYFCQEIRINSDTGRDSADFVFGLNGWRLTGNTMASPGGELDGRTVVGQILEINGPNFPSGLSPQAEFARNIISDHNIWSKNTADAHGDKYLYSSSAKDKQPDINLKTWQAQENLHGKQDLDSKFVYPVDFTDIKDPTIKK